MSAPSASVSIDIDAPADVVWKLVADLGRMGEWSPETTEVTWKGGAKGPAVGATFRGSNRRGRLRWSTSCRITAAEAPRHLAWDVHMFPGRLKVANWSYTIDILDERSCRVTETAEDHRPGWFKAGLERLTGITDQQSHNAAGMQATLERIKEVAEFAP